MGCTGRLCAAEQLVKAQRFHCKMVQTACGGKGMPDPLSPDDTVRPVTPPLPPIHARCNSCNWSLLLASLSSLLPDSQSVRCRCHHCDETQRDRNVGSAG